MGVSKRYKDAFWAHARRAFDGLFDVLDFFSVEDAMIQAYEKERFGVRKGKGL